MSEKQEMKTYLFSYNYAGAIWCFEIKADSPEDAQARVKRLAFAAYDGELIARIPATPGAGWLVRFVTWLMNGRKGAGT